jgi:phosphotriesterase-related protein
MSYVETVRGRIDPQALGITLMHEHLITMDTELELNYPNPEWDEERVFVEARAGLTRLRELGVRTLVDVTVLGLGRDIQRIERLLEGVEMNVVVATGYYTFNVLPPYFSSHGIGRLIDDGVDPLERMFTRDITEGIAGTAVRAGVIKVASDADGITADVERVLTAACHVHADTGVPITTHTRAANRGGLAQQQLFEREGADLQRVIIGHCGDSDDLDYLRALMDKGSTIGMDRFGMDHLLPFERRIETIVTLCAEGYADRMIISHDAGYYSTNIELSVRKVWEPTWENTLVSLTVLPRLRERGVSDAQIDQMMQTNPARLLAMA